MENSVLLVRIYLPEIPRVPSTRSPREKKTLYTVIHHVTHTLTLSSSFSLSLSPFLSLSLRRVLSASVKDKKHLFSYFFPFFFTSGTFPANEKNSVPRGNTDVQCRRRRTPSRLPSDDVSRLCPLTHPELVISDLPGSFAFTRA